MQYRRIAILAAPILAAFAMALPAQAATTPHADISFAVSPTRVVVPKNTLRHTIKVTLINTGKNPLSLTSTVDQLHQAGGHVTAKGPLPNSGAGWVTVSPAKIHHLLPGAHAFAYVHIRVPARHSPGQKALAVVWTTVNHSKVHGSAARILTSIATPEMIINVTGKVVRHTSASLSAPFFSMGGPVPVTYTIANQGNVYSIANNNFIRHSGKTIIKFPGALVLAGSTEVLHSTWTSAPSLCLPCRLAGPAGTSATVWRVPLVPAGGLLLVLLALSLAFYLGRRGKGRTRALRAQGDKAGHPSNPGLSILETNDRRAGLDW